MTTIDFREVFDQLRRAGALEPSEARRAFDAILAGQWAPTQIAAFVAALAVTGESAEVITSAAESMRAAMVPVVHSCTKLLDTAGTGGDGLGTVNLSTGAAIIAAAAGVPVAKHGNRAASSKTGTADVLEALGIPMNQTPEAASEVLARVGITFLLAPTHHPAMRYAGPVRRELGIRTIFNCLGPLVNPARSTHQLIGTFDETLRPVFGQCLKELGSERAWVVHGEDGLDEVSPTGVTKVTELSGGQLTEFEVVPEDFGFERGTLDDIRGGDAPENARTLETILAGQPHPARTAILLNAAAALVIAEALSPREAAERAIETVDSGKARSLLERWGEAARSLSKPSE